MTIEEIKKERSSSIAIDGSSLMRQLRMRYFMKRMSMRQMALDIGQTFL